MNKKCIAVFFTCIVCVPAFADQSSDSWFSISPVILDGEDHEGTSLGVKYDIDKPFRFVSPEEDEDGFGPGRLDPNAIDKAIYGVGGYISFKANGTWVVNEDENPQATASARIEGGYDNFQDGYEIVLAGFAAQEGNQDYTHSNTVYGASAAGHYSYDPRGSYVDLSLDYGQVDASEDEERLMVTDDDRYNRFSGELQLSWKVPDAGNNKTSVTSLQLNYRYFMEIDAPDAVEEAGFDKYRMVTYLLKFPRGLYAAYSTGDLPFDKQNDRVFEVGFTQTLF